MLMCKKCEREFHPSCARINRDLLDQIKAFFCQECESEGELTVWKKKRVNNKERHDKLNLEFDVEAILDHRVVDGKRQFYVKWLNYGGSENTWEPEENFQNSFDMLQKYCRSKNLKLSKIKGLYGAAPACRDDTLNPNAWVSIDEVLDVINKWSNHKTYKCNIDIVEFKGRLHKRDIIYVVGHLNHCYVVLYIAKHKRGYISDGRNTYIEDVSIRRALKDKLKVHLSSARYSQQTKVDHCAISAAVIALEMKRCYKLQRRPRQLIATKTMLGRTEKTLSKDSSLTIDDRLPVHKRFNNSCKGCGKSYYNKNRRGITGHENKCKKFNKIDKSLV